MSNYTLKISNFQNAAPIQGDSRDYEGLVKGTIGKSDYAAPEMTEDAYYKGVKVDIYAAGIVLHQIVKQDQSEELEDLILSMT